MTAWKQAYAAYMTIRYSSFLYIVNGLHHKFLNFLSGGPLELIFGFARSSCIYQCMSCHFSLSWNSDGLYGLL